MIRLDDEQFWLYAAVDLETNELLYTQLEPTRTNVIAHSFFHESREKHDAGDAVFLVDGATPLSNACRRHGLDFSSAKAETANEWLRSLAFAWNQLI